MPEQYEPIVPLRDARPFTALHDDESAEILAAVFGALANRARVRVVAALIETGGSTTGELERFLRISRDRVQHHCRWLERVGMAERDGDTWRMTPDALERVRHLLQ